MRKKFPTFAIIVLVFAVIWLLKYMNLINIDLPWIPIILIIISIGAIINRMIVK